MMDFQAPGDPSAQPAAPPQLDQDGAPMHQAVLPTGEVLHFPRTHTPQMMIAAVKAKLAEGGMPGAPSLPPPPDPATVMQQSAQNMTHHLQASAQTIAESVQELQAAVEQITAAAQQLSQMAQQMTATLSGATQALSTAISGALGQLTASVAAASATSADVARAAGKAHSELAGAVLSTVPANAGAFRQGVEALRTEVQNSAKATTKALRAPRHAVQDAAGNWSTVVADDDDN